MAAITNRLLHFRPILRSHPYKPHYFSSSSDDPLPESEPESVKSSSNAQFSFSSYMNEVKSSLQREPYPQSRLRRPLSFSNPKPPPLTPPPPSKTASISEIQKNLNEFRTRSAPPPPSSKFSVSFQDLYKKNVLSMPKDGVVKPLSNNLIRESLRNMQPNPLYPRNNNLNPASLDRFKGFKESLKPNPNLDSTKNVWGTDGNSLPASILRREKKGSENGIETAFLKTYEYQVLGSKLKMLRPEKKKGNWFSLQELNERLEKLIEVETKNDAGVAGGLRASLLQLKHTDEEKIMEKKSIRLEGLSLLDGTPDYMLLPPKGELVDKYFHPDNMSSAEKMKLELQKVRDEFKMSESDCGSARVQVAQLTTKIKHLSTVLQKKDKHSRKGLHGMVQRRKKLLKYLRRTDWDSYCLVLSKLGLRDNPDAKA